jgi:hypothetical protein
MTSSSECSLAELHGSDVPLLIHYHIFKNAGTSFEWALEQTLGAGFRSFDSSTPRGLVTTRDLADFCARHPEVRAISTHQAAPPAPSLDGRKVLTSVLIRDPIARVRSVYAFERKQAAATPGALKAKELDFRHYVEWRLKTTPTLLCNFQVYFCSRTEQNRAFRPADEHLEKAAANLDAVSIVGTVARYAEWLSLAQKILSAPFPNISLASSRQNITLGHDRSEAVILKELIDEIGEAIVDELIQNNQLDMRLHQIADALLTRRLAEQSVGVALYQAYTSARNQRLTRGTDSYL